MRILLLPLPRHTVGQSRPDQQNRGPSIHSSHPPPENPQRERLPPSLAPSKSPSAYRQVRPPLSTLSLPLPRRLPAREPRPPPRPTPRSFAHPESSQFPLLLLISSPFPDPAPPSSSTQQPTQRMAGSNWFDFPTFWQAPNDDVEVNTAGEGGGASSRSAFRRLAAKVVDTQETEQALQRLSVDVTKAYKVRTLPPSPASLCCRRKNRAFSARTPTDAISHLIHPSSSRSDEGRDCSLRPYPLYRSPPARLLPPLRRSRPLRTRRGRLSRLLRPLLRTERLGRRV